MTKLLILSKGKVAHVDDEDYSEVSKYKWCYRSGYAARGVNLGRGKHRFISLHRDILKPLEGEAIDHVDGNPLNNRRSNLRIATQKENRQNSRKHSSWRGHPTSSKYKGVSWDSDPRRRTKRWLVRIKFGGRRIRLSGFDTEVEAALAYNSAALKYFGEFARLNEV